ncbi:hypothetical protein N0V87_009092 [Didymella glomerata]|uniref:Uncharacterized protein n=1 Tax=Didymella glomerata TaxID=749621 RepID=A0A9W8WRS1_9PLEO|nr:hypothetical protein N0V87_009092 [Didymella glomerata]
MISVVHARQAPGPLSPPPPTEYLNEDLAPRMLAIDGILFGLAMICVLLRVYVRAIMLKTFGVDDWIMIVAAYHFFEETDFSGRGAWYYIWQQ